MADFGQTKEHWPQDIQGVSFKYLPEAVWHFLPFSHSNIFWPDIVEQALTHCLQPTHLLKSSNIEYDESS